MFLARATATAAFTDTATTPAFDKQKAEAPTELPPYIT